jgi:hypothetical protein
MARQKAAPTRIQKSGNGHTYYLDGEWCPGVTTVLSNGIPKPGLIGWASKVPAEFVADRLTTARTADGRTRIVADDLVEELRRFQESRTGGKVVKWSDSTPLPRLALADALANVRFLDLGEAAAKGTDVHNLAERLARGEEVDVPEELAGHVESYLRFLDEWEPANARLELVGINRRWRYMGKMDLLADFPGKVWSSGPWEGRPVGRGLLDIKTARSGIFAEVALQLQAYRFSETILGPDGYDVIPFDVTGDPRTDAAYRTFLYAKQVGEWLDWKSGASATVKLDAARTPASSEG